MVLQGLLQQFNDGIKQYLSYLISIIYRIMESSQVYKQHLQKLYNQNTVVEDSQLTSFCYLKTLALEFLTVVFTLVSIVIILINYFHPDSFLGNDKFPTIIFLFTILTMITIVLEKLSYMQWTKQKKDYENKPGYIIGFMIFELFLLLPTPNPFLSRTLTLSSVNIYEQTIHFSVEDLLSAYVLTRSLYVLKFIIHCEIYYGSRPDRLSRLYTVRFGTFNAFKFLINEKPQIILIIIFVVDYLFLPLILLLVQGKVNSNLNSFVACLYFQVVTQVTVGYGDILVSTYVGRGIVLISIIIGITTTSILLIFFMRLMEQDSSQQQSHSLLRVLQRKKQLTKTMVERVETQISYMSKNVPSQKKEEYLQKLNEFKFKHSRKIRYHKQTTPNLKRMMMSNFSSLLEGLYELKQTQIMLAKYVKIIQNSNDLKNIKQMQENKSK